MAHNYPGAQNDAERGLVAGIARLIVLAEEHDAIPERLTQLYILTLRAMTESTH
jgi:hypothetical protein